MAPVPAEKLYTIDDIYNLLDDSGCHGAPDWVIEIVSPGSRKMDYYTKQKKKPGRPHIYWAF